MPVPPVAVDYLLQPYRPAVDAAPVLRRLVNTQFVRREAGRYYLHQVDRDYALSRIPSGVPADRDADPPPFTQQALRRRGADYFEQTRTPRDEWKNLDDLAPTLSEYELRCLTEDYDAAAIAMEAIGEYLFSWGHYRLAAGMYERLQGRIEAPWINAAIVNLLAACYQELGQLSRAADCYRQSLATVRELGDRPNEAAVLGNLGGCYLQLGHLEDAADSYRQALVMAQQAGTRTIESSALCGIGLCQHHLGELTQAIDSQEKALAIARDIGSRSKEGSYLDNRGNCRRDLGQLPEAIILYQQALPINRDIGHRYEEAFGLIGLAETYVDLGAWRLAADHGRQAVEIADAISNAETQSGAWLSVARTMLLSGDLPAALEAARAASERPRYPPLASRISLLLGISRLRLNEPDAAVRDFRDAIDRADEQLRWASGAYAQHDTRALALCGLALASHQGFAEQAAAAFRAARAVTGAAGIVG